MPRKPHEPYTIDVSRAAIVPPTYQGTPEQIAALRATLLRLVKGDGEGGKVTSIPALLRKAGLDGAEGRTSYDSTALSRFIHNKTDAPNPIVAAKLYQTWIGGEHMRMDLSAIDNVFYHATMVAMDINPMSQKELARILCGYYLIYKRSSLNRDLFVRGLLTVTSLHGIVHASEVQHHRGGDGMPETEEVEEGYAVMKGNVIYLIMRSNALKGATFTVINNHPVRSGRTPNSEEIATLLGFRVGGREYSDPTESPFAAERISSDSALRARKDRNSPNSPGFIEAEEVPRLLRRHLRV